MATLLTKAGAADLIRSLTCASRVDTIAEHYQMPMQTMVARSALEWQYAAINGIRARIKPNDPVPHYHLGDGYVGTSALDSLGKPTMPISKLLDAYPTSVNMANKPTFMSEAIFTALQQQAAIQPASLSSGALHGYLNSIRAV